eukprot:COSAG02_NODE_6555_length_3499_cov_3.124706_4_plen_74_part_00
MAALPHTAEKSPLKCNGSSHRCSEETALPLQRRGVWGGGDGSVFFATRLEHGGRAGPWKQAMLCMLRRRRSSP